MIAMEIQQGRARAYFWTDAVGRIDTKLVQDFLG
jgi:hypothetical protein